MAKILLIKATKSPFRFYDVASPPLGVMYLASYLKVYGHEVKIIDARIYGKSAKNVIKNGLQNFKPDIVGISALTVEAPFLHGVAEWVKKWNPRIPVVAGGPHPTHYPNEVLMDKNVDVVAIGEGENTMLELAISIEKREHLEDVRGIAYRKNDKVFFTPKRKEITDLDNIPFPAWELIEIESYRRTIRAGPMPARRYMDIITTRGCPYQCIYCHRVFEKAYRKRSVDNVMKEMETLIKDYEITDFEIFDDAFNCDLSRAKTILKNILDKGWKIDISFPNGLRGDRIDDEFISLLHRLNVKYVAIAIESGSERIQKLIRKNLNLKEAMNNIAKISEKKIYTFGFFMLGFPTETKKDMTNTVNFAVKSKLHSANFFFVTPFKNTPLEREYGHLSNFSSNFNNYEYFVGVANLSDVDTKTLHTIRFFAYIKFFLYRFRFLKTIKHHPDKKRIFIQIYLLLVDKMSINRYFFSILRGLKKTTFKLFKPLTDG